MDQTLESPTCDPIVSVDWLVANRSDVIIVDGRAYLDDRDGHTNYLVGHLPGAVFVDLDTVVAGPAAPIEGRHPLPDPDVFARGLGAVGIGHDTVVVVYDDLGGMIGGRLVWMLRALGQDAALLDGGLQAWVDSTDPNAGSLETGVPTTDPVDHEPRTIPANRLASAEEVAAHVAAGGVVADSRAAPRYAGDIEPIDAKAGHIPGAINLPFSQNLLDGAFLPLAELAQRFAAAGVDSEAIVYCGSGVSACNNLLAVEAAGGGTPRLYVGSWSGWSSDPTRSVETGPHSSA